jgi:hypothetical protein
MILRCAQLGAFQRGPRVGVVGVKTDGFGELDDGEIVVLAAFGRLTAAQRTRRGAPGGNAAEQKEGGGPPARPAVRNGWTC